MYLLGTLHIFSFSRRKTRFYHKFLPSASITIRFFELLKNNSFLGTCCWTHLHNNKKIYNKAHEILKLFYWGRNWHWCDATGFFALIEYTQNFSGSHPCVASLGLQVNGRHSCFIHKHPQASGTDCLSLQKKENTNM